MKNSSLKTGFGFGLASGVITTLGLMIGLFATTNSKGIVLSGILTIAIADSCSDAVGIHFSQESRGDIATKDIWFATLFTFLAKFIVTISFVPSILILSLKMGILANLVWGFLLLMSFSYVIALQQKNNPYHAMFEHFVIMSFVIGVTFYVGKLIESFIRI